MPRTKPRPYTRWAALDAIRDVDGIRALTETMIERMLAGTREDELAEIVLHIRQLIDTLRDRLLTFRDGPDLEQIVEWVFQDEALLCLIVHRLEEDE